MATDGTPISDMTNSAVLSARLRKAFLIALVVGPILTLINQWEGLFAGAPFSVGPRSPCPATNAHGFRPGAIERL